VAPRAARSEARLQLVDGHPAATAGTGVAVAAEVPPADNLSWFTDQGADLVVFSGGKAIRGPQTTGILAGRADLVESAAFQQLDMHAADDVWDPPNKLVDRDKVDGVPRQGIGRPLKTGKEEIAGLVRALECFVADTQDEQAEWAERAHRIAGELDGLDHLSTEIRDGERSVAPAVAVHVDEADSPVSARGLVGALRAEEPRVFVGADDTDKGRFTVNPMCLSDPETDHVLERIAANLGREAGV